MLDDRLARRPTLVTERQRDLDARGAPTARRACAVPRRRLLAEVADELGLSHRRVHQLLGLPARPGARGPGRQSPELACSFCERTQSAVIRLIAGAGVAVRSDCVALATQTVRTARPPPTPAPRSHPPGPRRRARSAARVRAMARADSGSALICAQCVDLCNEILVEVQPDPS